MSESVRNYFLNMPALAHDLDPTQFGLEVVDRENREATLLIGETIPMRSVRRSSTAET